MARKFLASCTLKNGAVQSVDFEKLVPSDLPISNTDGSITIDPSAVISLNPGHANTWTGNQTIDPTGGLILPSVLNYTTPALRFGSDLNSGISWRTAGVWSLVGGGNELLRITSSSVGVNTLLLFLNAAGLLVVSGSGVLRATQQDGSTPGWLQQEGRRRVQSDANNSTASMANLSDLSVTLIAGRAYEGRLVAKCVDSVATDGIAFDFNGGTATMTNFWAGGGILASGGTDVIGNNIATALGTAITFTTFTGESIVVIELSFTCNAGGTFIPRFAQAAHTTGTATVRLGSKIVLNDTIS